MIDFGNVRLIKISYYWWLIIILLCAIGVLLWSIIGVIYTEAQGKGIILPTKKPMIVASPSNQGKVIETLVKPGDIVKKGQIVAKISQTSLERELKYAKLLLNEYLREQKILTKQYEAYILFGSGYKEEADNLKVQQLTDYQKQKEYYDYLTNAKKGLYDQKLIPITDYENTQIQLFDTLENLFNARNTYNASLMTKQNTDATWIEQILNINLQVLQQQSQVDMLEDKIKSASIVTSPINGIVNQILVTSGMGVEFGSPLITISEFGNARYMIIFLTPEDGKKIKENSKVYIDPSTTNRYLDGYILAKVNQVNEYSYSSEAISAILSNDTLASSLSNAGLTFIVWAELDVDPNTKSGLKWTSKVGPDYKITPGTSGDVYIVIKTMHPIELILPFLRSFFSIGDK